MITYPIHSCTIRRSLIQFRSLFNITAFSHDHLPYTDLFYCIRLEALSGEGGSVS
jgi:hypothetical protein